LNGRYPVGVGTADSGTQYSLGQKVGTEHTTILQSNLPSFTGQLKVSSANANLTQPEADASIAVTGKANGRAFDAIPSFVNGNPDTAINAASVTFMGANQPINNVPPCLGLNYIICVEGIYPSRP